MTGEPVIRTEGLTKRFGRITAVDDARPRRARGRRLRLPRRERLRQDHDGPDAARPGAGHVGTDGGARRADAGRRARRCCRRSARWSRGRRRTPHLSGRANLALFDAMGPAAAAVAPGGAGSTTPSSGSASARRRRAPGPRLLARHAAAARPGRRAAAAAAAAGARRADQRPRPAGHPRDPRAAARAQRGRAPRSSSPATCSPRSSRCAPGSACSTAAGWCCRTSSPTCSGRPAGSWCARPTSTRVRALLDGVVERVRRRAAAGPRRRPGGAQRAAGRRRRPGHRARPPSGAGLEDVVLAPRPAGARPVRGAVDDRRRAGQAGAAAGAPG